LARRRHYQQGWYSTNQQWLDITKRSDWDKVFQGKRLITNVVAEHVFEHLTYDECRQALANMSAHMVDRARIRIAVPDGYHPGPRQCSETYGRCRDRKHGDL
jgi:predicted SAM-dependent methyltransferase